MEKLYTVQELADYLSVKPQTVYAYVNQKQIDHRKIGGNVRFSETDIERFVKKKAVKAQNRREAFAL